MTLVEFKFIYFWEWFHRFFARLIGVIFLIPLLFIIFKKQFPKQFTVHIFLIGFFLMTQAVVGWYMVKSGLVDRVDVSQYRLSLHLTLAFIILGLIFYTLLIFFSENFDYYHFTAEGKKDLVERLKEEVSDSKEYLKELLKNENIK